MDALREEITEDHCPCYETDEPCELPCSECPCRPITPKELRRRLDAEMKAEGTPWLQRRMTFWYLDLPAMCDAINAVNRQKGYSAYATARLPRLGQPPGRLQPDRQNE